MLSGVVLPALYAACVIGVHVEMTRNPSVESDVVLPALYVARSMVAQPVPVEIRRHPSVLSFVELLAS